jgi:hypothetical protein
MSNVTIINLTLDDVHFYHEDGKIETFPKSGKVARVNAESKEVGKLNDLKIKTSIYGEIQDLPEKVEGVYLIVSAPLRALVSHRNDVLSPIELVRNEKDQIVGCRAFEANDVFTLSKPTSEIVGEVDVGNGHVNSLFKVVNKDNIEYGYCQGEDFIWHREDGPAVEYKNGKLYYRHGCLHREDGPAYIHEEEYSYYLEGTRFTEEGFKKALEAYRAGKFHEYLQQTRRKISF